MQLNDALITSHIAQRLSDVTSRGNAQVAIFEDNEDRELFLCVLERPVEALGAAQATPEYKCVLFSERVVVSKFPDRFPPDAKTNSPSSVGENTTTSREVKAIQSQDSPPICLNSLTQSVKANFKKNRLPKEPFPGSLV